MDLILLIAGFYNYPTVYTYPYSPYGLTHSSPYLPLVYTHPQVPTIYMGGRKRPDGRVKTSPQQTGQRRKRPDGRPQKNYKPSYPSTISKKSIPYGCNVDYKVKYDIEKVEYFDEKCDTKYK